MHPPIATRPCAHVYLSFFFDAPLVLAVPRNSFIRFFRCLPALNHQYACPFVFQYACRRTLLPARLLNLRGLAVSHQPVVRLELLDRLRRVVDEREARALATAVLGPETEA